MMDGVQCKGCRRCAAPHDGERSVPHRHWSVLSTSQRERACAIACTSRSALEHDTIVRASYSLFIVRASYSLFIVRASYSLFIVRASYPLFIVRASYSLFIVRASYPLFIVRASYPLFIVRTSSYSLNRASYLLHRDGVLRVPGME